MKEHNEQKINPVLDRFMDLFILENIQENNKLSSEILSENAPEAIQISLEPEVYEDIPLLKEIQNHILDLAINREKNQAQITFQDEVKYYMDSILMECLNHKMLKWTNQEIINKWKQYSSFEKQRMMDFVVVFQGVCQFLDKKTAALESGRGK